MTACQVVIGVMQECVMERKGSARKGGTGVSNPAVREDFSK